VQYLRLGDLQLHLFQRDTPAPAFHHIGINVDDFEAAYERVQELGIAERDSFFEDLYELPDGSVQMYLRDPAGNLVELDWPDVTTLDRSRVPDIKRLADSVPQAPEAQGATLYL
jgi:catechol 2,3-dioxygenase-like lactoylglutathione lyase family enzyme